MSIVRREVLTADGVGALARELAPPPPDAAIGARVAAIVARVRAGGDDALLEIIRTFDAPGMAREGLCVSDAAIRSAVDGTAPELRAAIEFAARQVRTVAERTKPGDGDVTLDAGQRVRVRSLPVGVAGVYVPGGRAVYPSSVIMATVPAQVAGVARIVVCSPPTSDGAVAPAILATAGLLGVSEVYAVGGPAAIAALAFGTATVPRVDVIAGPGNAWVQEAKRQVYGTVGIDGIAGPSEVVIITDAGTDPAEIAADVLAQAEHGPDSPAIVLAADPAYLDRVAEHIARSDIDANITLVQAGVDTAFDFAEAFAPEHLQVNLAHAEKYVSRIRSAGCVFLGPNGGTAFGDYVAGSNHILPTGGAARFASAVSCATYMRRMSLVELTDEAVITLTPPLARLADAEGYVHHRRSAEIRAARVERPTTQ
jgi:histidinol dehydrogenase